MRCEDNSPRTHESRRPPVRADLDRQMDLYRDALARPLCPDCDGWGVDNGHKCLWCNGEGS